MRAPKIGDLPFVKDLAADMQAQTNLVNLRKEGAFLDVSARPPSYLKE